MSSPLPSPTAAAEAPLVELTVSYAMVPPDDSFVRCAKLNTPAYIWAKRSDAGDPIVEVKLLKGEEAAPAEFKKLPEDLVRAADPKLGFFLAIRRGGAAANAAATAASPIVDLRILSDEEPVPESFIKLEGDITRAGDVAKYGVYIKTRASKDKKQKELAVGDFIDVLDTVNKWCVGRIVDKNEKEVLVHYEGWSDKWNEWMSIKASKRIAPYRTYTRGRDTGPESNDKAFVLTDNNLRDFQQVAARLEAIGDKPAVEFSDEERQFITVDVAKFVQNVLNAVIDDPEVLPHVPKFLKRVLQLIINYFRGPQEVPDTVVDSFVRIFDGDPRARRFYNKYGLAIPKDKSMDKDGNFAKKPNRDGAGKELLNSAFLIENINFFGDQGGFKLIVERLLDQKRVTSFHCLRMVIRAVTTVREHLLPAFAKDFITKIASVVVPRVQTITDDELKTIDREALNEVVRGIEALMIIAGLSAASTAEFVEKTNLDISRRLMTCKLLEKRINGVQELRDTIDRVRRREQPNWGVTNPYAPRPEVAKFLTPEILVRWMNEQKVIEVLLGPSSHLELIRRAPAVLKFLAYQNALTPEDLDTLWSAGQGKHETVTRVVFDCVAELASELTVKQLDQLFARVAAIPLNEYREVLLLFLKQFTINAVRNPSVLALPPAQRTRPSWYGLDIFWQLIQDNVDGLPADAAELSLSILGELLCTGDFEPQKLFFLEKCVLNLKEQTSVAQALKVAKRVIDSYPIGVRASVTVESLLHNLETKMGLLQLLINDFKQYNILAHKAIAERTDASPASPASPASAATPLSPRPTTQLTKSLGPVTENSVFLGRYSHAVQIDTRLEFLDYVLSHSAQLSLSKEHVEVLWNTFVTRAVVPSDRNKLLRWLSDARDDANPREFTALNDEVTQFIFISLLSNPERMDLPSISKRGYACFQFYFGYVNQALGNMEWPTKANRSRRMLVTKFSKLAGLDSLWTIAAAAVDPEVATLAGTLLIALHTRLDQALSAPEKKKEIFKTFVDKSMKLLSASFTAISQGQDVEGNKRQAAQVVSLLETFLFQIEEHFHPDDDDWRYVPPANPRQSLQLMVTVKENNADSAGQRMTVNITSDNKIGVMRRELAKHLKIPPELIQFMYMGRVLYPEEYDDLSIGEARITRSRDAIFAIKMGPEDKLSRPPEDAKSSLPHSVPRLLLSNDHQYFELLFSLLKLGGRLGQGVWRLLMRLPTNVELSTAIKSLSVKDAQGQPHWVRLFDPSAPLKLYYSMQILERLVTVKETDSDARRAEVQQWCTAFLEQGGLKHLFTAVMSWDLDELFADSIPQQCAAHVFSILLYFLTQRNAAQAEKIADSSVPLDKFLPQLLSIMNRATSTARDACLASAAAPVGEGVVDSVGETQAALLTQSMGLLINMVSRNPKTLAIVYAYPQLADVFFQSLVCPVGRIRETALESLLRFCALFDRPPPSAADLEAKSDAPPPAAPAPPPLDPANPSLLRPRAKLLPLLLACLPQINTEHSFCGEYFDAIQSLLSASRPEERGFNTATLSRDLAEKIVNHAVVEVRSSDNDTVLRGLLGLTRELVKADPSLKIPLGQQGGLINELFHNCLFALPSPATGHQIRKRGAVPLPKCKSRLSREKAFGLLSELVRGEDTNFKQVLSLMLPLHMVPHTNGARPYDWEFEAKLEEKSETGYVGLKNPGCVCYMNSLMQQLFMIPPLRQQVLAVPDSVKGDEPPQDSFFHQLQFILAFLQESEKQYCDPSGFCHAFKDWEGQPTNINVQMDAQEFLNMLFDRIDTKVKGSPSENVLKSSLGGTFSNELICKGCPHYKERREEFYAISVDVKNKKNLAEAMASFVEGEMLEGDNAFLCGVCNKKVDTLKRTCLKTLPPTVIFHLKRFEFDFDKMQKVKLNDRFEFPRRINLKPYTQEALAASQPNVGAPQGQSEDGKDKGADGKDNNDGPSTSAHPDEYYDYELSGVLVHTGSADRGHYYSFIRERAEGDEPAPERWFEFNDTFVRPFDPAQLEEECYGGEEARPRPSYYGAEAPMGMMAGPRNNQYNPQGQQQMMEKYRNAYLLFYDRVKPATEIKVSAPEPLPSTPLPALVREPSKVAVPSGILSSIAEQNITYSRDRAVYDTDYFNFVWDLVTNRAATEDKSLALPAADNLSATVCELLTRFVIDTLARSARKETFPQFMSVLRRFYGASASSCVWLLETVMQPNNRWLADLFFYCSHAEVRKQATTLLLVALNTVATLESDKLAAMSYDVSIKIQGLLRSKETAAQALSSMPITFRLAQRMSDLLRDAPDHWKRFDQFFAFFSAVARVHPRVTHYLVSCNLPGRLVDLLLAEESPLRGDQTEFWKDSKGRRRRMGDEWGNVPDLSHALVLLSSLVCSVRTTVPPPPTYALDPADPKPAELHGFDKQMLLNQQFLAKWVAQATSRRRGAAVSSLVCHLCWESAEVSEVVVGLLSHGIEEGGDDDIRPYFRTLQPLIALADSLQEKRVHIAMHSLLTVMKANQQFWRVTMLCTEQFVRICKAVPAAATWVEKNQNKLQWVVDWLEHHPRPPAYNEPGITLFKRVDRGQYSAYQYQPPTTVSYGTLSPKQKQAAIFHFAKNGANAVSVPGIEYVPVSDSDEDLSERVFEVGQWIDCKDTVNKWCEGTIVNMTESEVQIHYDGWADKWDEWLDRSSNRIARYGRFTSEVPREKFKGQGPKPGDNIGGGKKFKPEEFAALRAQALQSAPPGQQYANEQGHGGGAEGDAHYGAGA